MDKFPRSTPEEQGLASAAITAFLQSVQEQSLELHSFMIVRNGYVVSEGWWEPYRSELPHMLFSLTKTFTSTAVGIASDEGLLNVNDSVIAYFPELANGQNSRHGQPLRIRDLLVMGTGHAEDTMPTPDGSWIAEFLNKPSTYEPGTRFAYHNAASNLLSLIVERASGQTLQQYLKPRLFAPLGINGELWDTNPDGTIPGGYGLRLLTEDIAKLGQLYLQKGVWEGERIVSEEWLAEASGKQISNGDEPDNDWNSGYGYQLWCCYRDGAYRFTGMFNQLCLVLPEHNAIVALTSATLDERPVYETIWKHLVPAMAAVPLEADEAAQQELRSAIQALSLRPSGFNNAGLPDHLAGERRFALEANEFGWTAVRIEPAGEGAMTFLAETAAGEHRITVRADGWTSGSYEQESIAAIGGWDNGGTLHIHTCLLTTPMRRSVAARFEGEKLSLVITANVGMQEPLQITGYEAKPAGASN
ncbi:serine hydrolase domain-containing protein [Paenibacillus protaetiae]|nr:serine hydrolase [Paenibacillus protaetiae]